MKSTQTMSTLSTKVVFLTRQVVYAFLVGLIAGGAALGFIDAYAKKPLFSNAQQAAVGSIRGQAYGGSVPQEASGAIKGQAYGGVKTSSTTKKTSTTKTSTTKTSSTTSNTKVASTTGTTSTTSTTSATNEAAQKKALAEIEAQVKTEYNKVYAAELKKGTPDAKAKQIAQKAADQKRAELTTLAAAATAVATAQKERAEYVARSYDGVDWEGTLSIKNPSGLNDVSELVTKLINWTLMIIAMVATIVIIISGIMLVFNGGNETTVKKSKTTILWAIVGLVVSVGAFAMVNIVQSLL